MYRTNPIGRLSKQRMGFECWTSLVLLIRNIEIWVTKVIGTATIRRSSAWLGFPSSATGPVRTLENLSRTTSNTNISQCFRKRTVRYRKRFLSCSIYVLFLDDKFVTSNSTSPSPSSMKSILKSSRLPSGGKPSAGKTKPVASVDADAEVCLRWNSHHSNMQSSFPSLLDKEMYVDVTLAAEGKTVKCHRVRIF